jgi:hypothetical protein
MKLRALASLLLIVLFACAPRFAVAAGKSVHVKGYTRKDGSYVPPHTRSAPRTSARGFTPSAPAFSSSTVPRDVPVAGYTKDDGSYVRPHMRHIDGIKDPESDQRGSSLRDRGHRTTHRVAARGLSVATKPKKRYPSRKWQAQDGSVLAEGRMQWRAMNKLHIVGDDGSVVDLKIDELGAEDRDWLDSVKRNPNGMKTDTVPDGGDSAGDQPSEKTADSLAESREP